LSWAFQILPYVEGGAIHNLKTTAQVEVATVPMYHCPSKRPPTRYLGVGGILMDYAAAVPFPMPADVTRPGFQSLWDNAMKPALDNWGTVACRAEMMWSGVQGGPRFENQIDGATTAGSTTAASLGTNYAPPMGVIVRSNYCATCAEGKRTTGFYEKISFNQISDGSSNTLVVSEKKVPPSTYDEGHLGADDRGWSDGWDFDTMRSTVCVIGPDQDPPHASDDYEFGSAHTAGLNAAFADASVRTMNFDIEFRVFNSLGHRSDGENLESGAN
jgi:hypothetical protein